MGAAGKLFSSVSSVAEKASPVIESANGVKELCKKDSGESNSPAPAGSPQDNAIQQLLEGFMQSLSGGSGSQS
ncbi:hypothetical protein [Paraburkholderia sp.]|uniref:hypothetical protein n=1 Tax=Paraburkholderia sp. TaxID=1926495 RepID=UPI003D6E2D09